MAPVVETYAYCLLKNHFHLLVKVKSEEEIIEKFKDHPGFIKNLDGLNSEDRYYFLQRWVSQQFSNFFNSYTKAYNKVYNRRGSLFMKNFKNKPVTSDSQLITTLIYIHLNPVKHDFTSNFEIWPWSSFHQLSTRKSLILSWKYLNDLFVNRKEFKKLHRLRQLQILSISEEF